MAGSDWRVAGGVGVWRMARGRWQEAGGTLCMVAEIMTSVDIII